MKKVKTYQEFTNEEINLKKALIGGAIVGGIGLGAGYLHDKSVEPKELIQSQHVDIPDNFKMKSKMLSMGTDMYVTNDNRDNFGKIEERILSWGKTFQYYDNTGKIVATAKEEVFSWGTKIDILDSNNNQIGSVEEEIIESMFSLHSIYSIKDANGNVIAKSKKIEFFVADVDIFDNSGKFVANFSQEGFTIGDVWDVNIQGEIDRRLIIFIPSFISSAQSERSSDDDDNNKNK